MPYGRAARSEFLWISKKFSGRKDNFCCTIQRPDFPLDDIDENLSLTESGLIDSLALLQVIAYLGRDSAFIRLQCILQHTYKPLLSESIVEFWNRYYYYFKELMVEFFFLPAYLRYFRNRAALRIITAVFAAAFVGNMYYHLLQAKNPLIAGDFASLWRLLGARLIYCFVLATGIAWSMLRQQKQRGPSTSERLPGGVYRLRRIAGVWTFFAVINFWNVTAAVTIAERARLFFSLFGF